MRHCEGNPSLRVVGRHLIPHFSVEIAAATTRKAHGFEMQVAQSSRRAIAMPEISAFVHEVAQFQIRDWVRAIKAKLNCDETSAFRPASPDSSLTFLL